MTSHASSVKVVLQDPVMLSMVIGPKVDEVVTTPFSSISSLQPSLLDGEVTKMMISKKTPCMIGLDSFDSWWT